MQGARSAAEEAKSAAEDAKSAAEEARDEAAQARTAVASIFELLQTMHRDVLDKFGTMSDEVKREREMQQEAVEKATGAASRSFLEAKGVLDKAEATRSAVHLVQGEVRDMKGKVEAMHSALEEINSSKLLSQTAGHAYEAGISCDLSEIKNKTGAIQSDVESIKSEVAAITTEVNEVKQHAAKGGQRQDDQDLDTITLDDPATVAQSRAAASRAVTCAMESIKSEVQALRGDVIVVKSKVEAADLERMKGDVETIMVDTQVQKSEQVIVSAVEATQQQTADGFVVSSMRHLRSDVDTIKTAVSAIKETLTAPPREERVRHGTPNALRRATSQGSLGLGSVQLPPVDGGAQQVQPQLSLSQSSA